MTPLVKIRVVIGCGASYELPSCVGAHTARTKFVPLAQDYVKIRTNSHQLDISH